MRSTTALLCLMPALLSAQAVPLDQGRLDPTWFGAAAAFQSSEPLGFQWAKPGLNLRSRSLRLAPWQPAVWLGGRPARKDRDFLEQIQSTLAAELLKGLQSGLKGTLPVATAEGDVLVTLRVVDAVGIEDNYMAMGSLSVTIDLKVVDGDTGELLAAFHDTHRGPSPEAVALQFRGWSGRLGQVLAGAARPLAPAVQAQPDVVAPFDLEGALRRIEGLRRDGLLTEAQCEDLRRKAAAKAR